MQVYGISGVAQGTTYSIKYYAERELIKQQSIDSIFNVIDQSMSLYKAHSAVNTFNKPTVLSMELNAHMLRVVEASFHYNKLTQGYFDITVYPLLQLWGFGPQGFGKLPLDHQIDSVKKLIGIDKINLQGKVLTKQQSHVSIDLNGIAQGYTVDVVAEYLTGSGLQSFLVEVGGEIYAKGLKSDNSSYKIEIQRPPGDQALNYKVMLKDMAITTSGSYEKYRTVNGQHYSHHMDPFKGEPMLNNVLSVTVIARTAMEADALDNYLMYLNPQEALAFVEKLPQVEAYIIYSENNTLKELQSSGFNNYIYKIQS
jgi:thiamine biosynthesis lipoprotein